MRRFLKFFVYFFIAIFLVLGAFVASYFLFIWNRYPRGFDATGHLFRLEFVRHFGLGAEWVHSWASGMPLFLLYAHLPYQLLALVSSLFDFSSEVVLTGAAVFAVGVTSFAVFLLVKELVNNWLIAIASGVLYLTSPSSWGMAFASGLYPRVLALPFFVLSIWLTFKFLKDRTRVHFVLTTFFIALTFLLHFFIGAAAFIVSFLLLVVWMGGLKEKIKTAFLLYTPSVLLVVFFILPFIWARMNAPGFLTSTEAILTPGIEYSTLKDFFYLINYESRDFTFTNFLVPDLLDLNPVITPLFLISGLVSIVFKLWGKKKEINRAVLVFVLFTIGGYIYSLFFLRPFLPLYGGILAPRWAVYFIPIFSIPASMLFLKFLLGRKSLLLSVCGFLIAGLSVLWFFLQYPLNKPIPRVSQVVKNELFGYTLLTENLDKRQFNFRLGTGNYADIGAWFNVQFPYVPQTRDFYNQAIVNPDFYFYLYYAGWEKSDNLEETNFLFDWFGVKGFVVTKESPVKDKFENKPAYSPIDQDGHLKLYQFNLPTPILSATNTPAFLVIGSMESYNTVFRSLSFAGMDSKSFIPVFGPNTYLDDYELSDLSVFPIVVLYDGYKIRDQKKVEALLREFMEKGGSLFIDDHRGEALFPTSILPVEGRETGEIHKWQLSSKGESLKIDPSSFAPPIFNDGPWRITRAKKIGQAEGLLEESGKPVLVFKEEGEGKILWSGLNLFFHTIHHQSKYESGLIGDLLSLLVEEKNLGAVYQEPLKDDLTYETSTFIAEFVHPEKRIVKLKEPATAVLFKESFFPNWQAKVNGKRAPIYKAGPGFMYVPLNNSKAGDEVVFVFGTHPIQWAGRFISLGTLVALLLWLFDWWIFKPYILRLQERLTGPFKSLARWWEREEE